MRLGLLAPRAAIALAALPCGNQVPAAAVVIRRGLTVAQIAGLVAELLDQLAVAFDGQRPGVVAFFRLLSAGPPRVWCQPRPLRYGALAPVTLSASPSAGHVARFR